MSVSLDYLQRCSALTGYGIGPLEKVVRLGELAADIFRHPLLDRVLALKKAAETFAEWKIYLLY